ncbi:MAG: CBS domain-containing protein [Thermogutta sp.]
MPYPHRKCSQSWQNLAFDTAGASMAEYAMLLLLILVTGMAGFFSLSSFAHWAFCQSQQWAIHDAPQTLPGSPETTDFTIHRLIARASVIISHAESAIQIAAGVIGLLLGVSLVLACWQILHSHRRPKTAEPSGTSEPPSPTPRQEMLFAKRAVLKRVLRRAFDTSQVVDLPVAKLMSENLVAVHPKTAVRKVAQTIKEKGVSHVLVIEHNGELLGIISRSDLSKKTGRCAADIMTREPLTIDVSASATQAVSLMLARDISCVPVMKDHRVRGVFTKTDVMIGFQALIQALELALAPSADEDESDELLETDASVAEELSKTLANGS